MSRQLATLTLTSSAFPEGQPIPKGYTGDGPDHSPPLAWSGVPADAQSLALIVDDPDAPRKVWVHWLLFDLPPTTRELAAGVPPDPELPNGARQGITDFGRPGYGGPAPPPGKPHRYYFKLYALDTKLGLPAGTTPKEQLLAAMQGHVIGEGQLMGTYGRPS
jgi:Raf kinase inhibitor-like YbhB/YbcL family protein